MFTRAQLLQEVWGYDFFGGTRTVDVHVRRLRAKLGPEYEALIGTVRNVGYKAVRPARGRAPAPSTDDDIDDDIDGDFDDGVDGTVVGTGLDVEVGKPELGSAAGSVGPLHGQ